MSRRPEFEKDLKNFEYRHAYVEEYLHARVAAQIRALREQRGLSQEQLASRAGMKQPRISTLENVNYTRWNARTLLKLARAFDLVLRVEFDTFSSGIDDIRAFGVSRLEKKSFGEEVYDADDVSSTSGRLLIFSPAISLASGSLSPSDVAIEPIEVETTSQNTEVVDTPLAANS